MTETTIVRITFKHVDEQTGEHLHIDWELPGPKEAWLLKHVDLEKYVKGIIEQWFPEQELKRYELMVSGRRL